MDSKVIRAPSLKRGKNDGGLNERIKLKKVLGLTVCSNAALDVSPTTGVLAYPAGCTVVLFNSKKLSQSYLLNTSRKAITAIAYSQCGRYVATGECGQNPAIKVWELDTNSSSSSGSGGGSVVAEFLGHKYAVSCIAFSPTGKYLVSVGSQHDMIVNVFDWKLNLKIASNKVSAKVVAVCFSQDGNYFVTVGNRHVKYWYLEGSRKYKEPIPLMGRSAILGELRNNDFCAVACGKADMADSTYAITRSGQLVEFNSRRLLDKWVACRTTSANCLCISAQYILVGCAEAIIRVFNAATLEYLTTLPRTHYLGADVAQGVHISHITAVPPAARFPDTIAMVFDEARAKVSCVYNDHSLYIWDLRDIRRVGKSHSFLYHSACIWGVESVPYSGVAASGGAGQPPAATVPMDCFLTCSSDDTIRFWALDEHGVEQPVEASDVYRRNIYSKDLLKVVYIDEELQFIKDVDNPILNMEKPSTYDGRNGVRCIKISPDRQHLATGDRSGNIRIYSLSTLRLITTIEAHDSEVLCLEYTNERIDRRMLASASRDRLIHVFDVTDGYRILQTLDDHSSSITSVKFIGAGATFQMVSCGADKAIIFRTFQGAQFLRGNNCSGKTTLYDMEIDSNAKHILTACQDRNIRIYGTQTAKHTKTFKGSHSDDGSLIKLSLDASGIYIATSCTDKTLSVYDYYSTECMARMYGHSELVTGLKFTNDCRHLISASGDGCIFIWQVPHDMVVTMQARLSQQALRSGVVVASSTAGSGQVPIPPLRMGAQNHQQQQQHPPPPSFSNPASPEFFGSPPAAFLNESLPVAPGYKFSDVGQLPQWAQQKKPAEAPEPVAAEHSPPGTLSSSPSQHVFGAGGAQKPRGRWAQKASFEPEAFAGGLPSPATPAISGQTSDYNSASSKDVYLQHSHQHQQHHHSTYLSEDSSIDSGMETRRELQVATRADKKSATGSASQQLQFESNNEHDGDVEDISDGERTSSEHGGLFYPAVHGPATPTGEFKVNAMNEDELRKSVRRQKFERQGLQLSVAGATAVLSSGGGTTGTSDDEDEGSTPSGDNAERSLASTLGGSVESIPASVAAVSASFLQAAIEGEEVAPLPPMVEGGGAGAAGGLANRGDRSRRSISAKHNSADNGSKSSFSKSFSNTKKDELMKVINEAKQKLENVGYRSTLRSSQSISDLSHAVSMERGSGLGRSAGQRNAGVPNHTTASSSITATSNTNYHHYHHNHHHHHHHNQSQPQAQQSRTSSATVSHESTSTSTFLNCAAPKSVLAQNCQFVRALQRDLPPYPSQVGIYSSSKCNTTATTTSSCSPRPSTLDVTSCASDAAHQQPPQSPTPPTLGPKHPSILKHYKSCPVSPVHEELDWSNVAANANAANVAPATVTKPPTSNTLPKPITCDRQPASAGGPKRHSMYSDDAQTILDMIHSDTEKMIAEITQKYGDLDEYDPIKKSQSAMELKPQIKPKPKHIPPPPQMTAKRPTPREHNFLSDDHRDDEDHFSSDSLEDCSLDLDHPPCRKHTRTRAPQRSVSDYFVMNPNRNVSLSDILNEDESFAGRAAATAANDEVDQSFLSTQRHSSASFFLGPYPDTRKSQESLLSDDCGGVAVGQGSYCNSMESILSDDSECKSAPLEALFIRSGRAPRAGHAYQQSTAPGNPYDTMSMSKSYGSSPNNTFSSGFDFYMQQHQQQSYRYADDLRMPATVTADMDNAPLGQSAAYPWITKTATTSSGGGCGLQDEFIPRLGQSRTSAAMLHVNKSLSKEFADHRHQHNTNPIYDEPKPLAVVLPSTPQIQRVDAVLNDPSVYVMRKSCSFDIEMFDGRRTQRSANKKYEQNLEKFEAERKHRQLPGASGGVGGGGGGTLAMDYVPHKPPVATRRSSSMRARRSNRNSQQTAATPQLPTKVDKYAAVELPATGVRSFEIYVAEKGAAEDMDSMDSLEFYAKPKDLGRQQSVDSLDECDETQKPPAATKSVVSSEFLTPAEYTKFRDIEKQIEVINKLVELEEKKLEQERLVKERRGRPFQCDVKQKGYVKSLTMNFDMLARREAVRFGTEEAEEAEAEEEERRRHKMKRNFSLPDVLEGAKFRPFCEVVAVVGDETSQAEEQQQQHQQQQRLLRMGFREGNPKSLMSHHHQLALSDDDPSASIRRACSLSDLSMGKGSSKQQSLSKPSATNSSSKPTPAARGNSTSTSSSNGRNPPKRTGSSVGQKSSGAGLGHHHGQQSASSASLAGMGTRSISVGTLNAPLSDSDPEAIALRGSGLLRSTIASQNKSNGSTSTSSRPYSTGAKSSAAGIISRRRVGLSSAYSSVNLTTAGQDDSSSEEALSIPPMAGGGGGGLGSSGGIAGGVGGSSVAAPAMSGGKPVVPPRPRSISVDHKRNGMAGMAGASGSPMRGGGGLKQSLDAGAVDVDSADLTSQLCANIISQLMTTTNSVMQLHQRLKHSEDLSGGATSSGGSTSNGSGGGLGRQKSAMLKELENAVIMTQSMLTKVTANRDSSSSSASPANSVGPHVTFFDSNRHHPESHPHHHPASAPQHNHHHHQLQNGNSAAGDYSQMLDKCTDMLQKVQKHTSTSGGHNNNSNNNNNNS